MYENKPGLGYQNFEEVRTEHIFYIDKTDFIREWWEYADKVTLITRPRRFGKTLNMSMTECFFSNKYAGRSDLFEGLSIWENVAPDNGFHAEKSADSENSVLSDNSALPDDSVLSDRSVLSDKSAPSDDSVLSENRAFSKESVLSDENFSMGNYKYRELQGTFPVIFLTFANIKAGNYADMEYKISEVIAALYEKNRCLLKGDLLSENERTYYKSIRAGMEDTVAAGAVHKMSEFMQRYYGKKVIILLDEYDTPMQEAWLSGYWSEAARFFSAFFNASFKTNDSLERGLITGITGIAKESIFSGMNHLEAVTTTSNKYATSFGFTEEEVFAALDDAGLGGHKEKVKEWYDGFTFGAHRDIYNPWSILSFIRKRGKYDTYWSNTSGNGLVNSLMQKGTPEMKQTMEDLLRGKGFETEIDENIVFDQLDSNTNAVWSLLLATGYLRVEKFEQVGRLLQKVYTLRLTNMEVESIFDDMIKKWFGGRAEAAYNDFVKALLLNDLDAMNEFMSEVALQSFSNFDIAKSASSKDAPERFYHGFVLGLMVELSGRFQITSNRESGFGRYDIMLTPSDRGRDNAYIIEFKVHKPLKEKDLEETVANALKQIDEKQYEAELLSAGFPLERIRKYGFAFRGKECLIG